MPSIQSRRDFLAGASLATPAAAAASGPLDLSNALDKKVLVRGRVQKEMQKGIGLTDVFVVKEFQVLE